MKLPPLEVAVYPIVPMSQGRQAHRPARSMSSVTPASVSSSASAATPPVFAAFQNTIRSALTSSNSAVQQVQKFPGSLHQVYLIEMTTKEYMVMKCPPTSRTRFLRHENQGLQVGMSVLKLIQTHTQLSIPKVIAFDPRGRDLGYPFLLTTHIPGRRLSDMAPFLADTERTEIDRRLGMFVRNLATLSKRRFGLAKRVLANEGYASWREAFLSLLEMVLQDAEDCLLTIPYEQIRGSIGQQSHFLDEITEPQLVSLDICDPRKVLVHEQVRILNGVVGFSNVVWGDPLLSRGVNTSEAFLEGYYYSKSIQYSGGARARKLMYTVYHAIVGLTTRYYRPNSDFIDDNALRSTLTSAIAELSQILT